MATRQIAQFRFFGDKQTKFNTAPNSQVIFNTLSDNQPEALDSQLLISGEAFKGYTPIVQLGIQSLPGLKFSLNSNLDPIIMGISGMYELDLLDSSVSITSLTFDKESLNLINKNPDGYLIIDIVYEED